MTDVIDEIYIRTPGYGTPFGSALTCLRCGVMVDGGQYTPAPTPRQAHAQWHAQIDALLAQIENVPAGGRA